VRVSVIIPTYKRPESLSRCLDALACQDTQPDEILVVVRHEDEASRERIRMRGGEPIRLVPITVPAGRPGLVAALNAGISVARGEIVCLTDDDAQPHRDWISRILATYAVDSKIGAVGGRDWVYTGERLVEGAEPAVGTISWFGRTTGNHHVGIGAARDVDVLKGVNLSMRGDLLRRIRFDARLLGLGTEHHWELMLCLSLRRSGYRIIYDPAIAVEHRPQPRVDEDREFGPRQVRDASHNETIAVLEHLPAWRRPMYLAWALAIGTTDSPGLAQTIRSLVTSGDSRWPALRGALTGRVLGLRTYLRSQRKERPRTGEHPAESEQSAEISAS